MSVELVPFTAQVPSLTDRAALAAHTGLTLHPEWPNPNFGRVLVILQAWFRERPELAAWVWFVVVDGQVVGEIGAKGLPDDEGGIEIGYGVVPSFRARGVATAAVTALIRHVRPRGVRRILAEVLDSNLPSQGVLARAGFRRFRDGTSDEGPLGWWEWRAPTDGGPTPA